MKTQQYLDLLKVIIKIIRPRSLNIRTFKYRKNYNLQSIMTILQQQI